MLGSTRQLRLRSRDLLIGSGVGLLVLAAYAFGEDVYRSRAADQRRLGAVEDLAQIRSDLAARLTGSFLILQGLAAHIAARPNIGQADFSRFAQDMSRGYPELRSVAAAPDLVVRFVHPLEENLGAVGLDYRAHPEQRAAAMAAVASRGIVIAGPLDLVQGGRGVIARMPVFLPTGQPSAPDDSRPGAGGGTATDTAPARILAADDPSARLWGLVAVVIDTDKLFAASHLDRWGNRLKVALRREFEAGGPIVPVFGDQTLFEHDPVTSTLALPQGTWQIGGAPTRSWRPSGTDLIVPRILAVFTALIVLVATVSIIRQRRAFADRDQLFRQMFEEHGAVKLLIDPQNGRIIDANRSAARFYGWSIPTLRTMQIAQINTLQPDQIRSEMEKVTEQGGTFAFKHRLASGDIRDVEVHSGPVVLGGQRLLHSIVYDVTDRLAAETGLRKSVVAAEEAYRAKAAFIAVMSHEIRTPLNAVLGFTEAIQSEVFGPIGNPRYRDYLGHVMEAGRHLADVIDDILDITKADTGQVDLQTVWMNPGSLIDRSVALVQERASARSMRITTLHVDYAAGGPVWIAVDATRMKQVLINLLTNSIKYSPAGTSITVKASLQDNGRYCLSVIDQGYGIPEDQLAEVMEPFRRGSAHIMVAHEGVGIGLSLCKRLVELHEGTLVIDSTVGQGTSVSVCLPADRVKIGAEPAAPRDRWQKAEPDAVVPGQSATA